MDSDLRRRMLAYYDERAPEYEEAFTLGTGTASIRDPEVLAEARAKANQLGILDRCVFRQGDFFVEAFDGEAYDTVLVGFFLSHLSEAQESVLFDILRTILEPAGRFLILDSAWSAARSTVNAKVECQERRLNDGTAFEIYKRYCDRDDVSRWARQYNVRLRTEHFGAAFYAVSGSFGELSQ